jgi:hypothetical protein
MLSTAADVLKAVLVIAHATLPEAADPLHCSTH